MGKYMDDPTTAVLRHICRFQELQAAYVGPEPRDDAALSKLASEQLAQEDRDAVYHPPESPRGCVLRDTVLAIDDLVAEIFVHCLPCMPSYTYSHPSPDRAPMLLVQVSRRWLRIALSTPVLWSSFPLLEKYNFRLFRLWMKRAGAHPLFLSVDNRSLKTIMPYSHRWSCVAFDFQDDEDCQPSVTALAAVKNRVPRLDSISIKFPKHTPAWGPREHPEISSDALECAPNLRSVLLDHPFEGFKLPFSQLLDATIFSAPADYILRVCTLACNLTTLRLAINDFPPNFVDMPLCHLPRLQYLWLFDGAWGSVTSGELIDASCRIAPLLAKFSCPALNKLDLSTLPKLSQSDHSAFKRDFLSFLERTPHITDMSFSIAVNDDDILLAILAHLPAVELLAIKKHSYSAAFCERLTFVPGSDPTALPPLCPRLRSFDMGWHHKLESADALVEMVASRWRVADDAPVVQLQRITVSPSNSSLNASCSLSKSLIRAYSSAIRRTTMPSPSSAEVPAASAPLNETPAARKLDSSDACRGGPASSSSSSASSSVFEVEGWEYTDAVRTLLRGETKGSGKNDDQKTTATTAAISNIDKETASPTTKAVFRGGDLLIKKIEGIGIGTSVTVVLVTGYEEVNVCEADVIVE
ncbi:hypothetical protein C8R46DRAFT_1195981 [Mycena filopes]|nr:hypothetical protein C8R46DRAFT_1195981 [Mycena filopes]